jgi:uncharacterized protein (DUF2141 family)
VIALGLLLSLQAALAQTAPQAPPPAVEVVMSGFASDDGQALVLVFEGEAGFPVDLKRAGRVATAPIQGGRATLRLGLPPGTYALAIIHDEDKDGDLDTFLGIPTEGLGCSNNAKGSFGPPPYSAAKFTVGADGAKQAITMMYIGG